MNEVFFFLFGVSVGYTLPVLARLIKVLVLDKV